MRTVAIIQGRMGSSRLPGKVLLDIAGRPMLRRVVDRTRLAHSLDQVLVATTTDPSDDPVAEFCGTQDIPCSRGSLHDVLDRYYQAALASQAGIIVRITGDCPLIDPALIDDTVALLVNGADFACNRLPPPFTRTYPIGLDVEVCTFAALERAWREADQVFQREHVMPYFYEGASLGPVEQGVAHGLSPRGFRIALLQHEPDYGSLRWTVDTPQDLEFARQVQTRLGDETPFTWYDVLRIVQNEPHLAEINAAVQHKTMTDIDPRAASHPEA